YCPQPLVALVYSRDLVCSPPPTFMSVMTVKSYLVATMLLALLPLAAASAQTTRTSQTAAKGGVQHRGRHSGYVPAHERSRQSAAKPKRQAPDQGEQYEEQYEEVVVSHNEPARTKARPASHRSEERRVGGG